MVLCSGQGMLNPEYLSLLVKLLAFMCVEHDGKMVMVHSVTPIISEMQCWCRTVVLEKMVEDLHRELGGIDAGTREYADLTDDYKKIVKRNLVFLYDGEPTPFNAVVEAKRLAYRAASQQPSVSNLVWEPDSNFQELVYQSVPVSIAKLCVVHHGKASSKHKFNTSCPFINYETCFKCLNDPSQDNADRHKSYECQYALDFKFHSRINFCFSCLFPTSLDGQIFHNGGFSPCQEPWAPGQSQALVLVSL